MATKRYVIGIDFGTLSARTVVVDAATGEEIAWEEVPYEHGVIEGALPDGGTPLPLGAARQDPSDYLASLEQGVRGALAASGVRPESVIGVGVDFTSCTLLPVDANGDPLCWQARFRTNPDAWVCLWKDQNAQAEATALTSRALELGETLLQWYGGKIPAESFVPKVWRISKHSPEVFAAAARFVEAGDWIVWRLTGEPVGSVSAASFKALWDRGAFPERYLSAVDPNLAALVREKVLGRYLPPGARAGVLTQDAADRLGLAPGTPVAVANIDAHAAVPGSGVATPGTMVLVMGTSLCHMLIGEERVPIPGIVGAVWDGIVKGYAAFEAGQPAVGDTLSWYAERMAPARYEEEAAKRGVSTQQYLESLAKELAPGEAGLVALDWWNGNRSPLLDGDLSGMIAGFSLNTKPEEVYMALMEGCVFGAYEIVRSFEGAGVAVERLRACGGIAGRSPLMMQLLADVTGRDIEVAGSTQASALGAAIFGAVAAGPEAGGYATVSEATARMAGAPSAVYRPDPLRSKEYRELHSIYRKLFDYFGRGDGAGALHNLKALRAKARSAARETVS